MQKLDFWKWEIKTPLPFQTPNHAFKNVAYGSSQPFCSTLSCSFSAIVFLLSQPQYGDHILTPMRSQCHIANWILLNSDIMTHTWSGSCASFADPERGQLLSPLFPALPGNSNRRGVLSLRETLLQKALPLHANLTTYIYLLPY